MVVKRVKWWERHINGLSYIIVVIMLIACSIVLFTPKEKIPADLKNLDETLDSEQPIEQIEISDFDPNKATYRELVEAGLPRNIAVSIIRWREAGKVYRIREDLALCYGMSDSLFFILEPHIIISEEHKMKPREREEALQKRVKDRTAKVAFESFSLDTASVGYLTLLGFTEREATKILEYRDIIEGYTTFEEFSSCYSVDSVMAERLRPYLIFPERPAPVKTPSRRSVELPVEINSADSATLCAVRGIGPKSVVHILRYRELLGGYHSVEQISELSEVTPENFQQILPQIYCDSAKIKKININFAGLNEMKTHPYLSSRMLKAIINKRVLKGGWSTIQEMIDDNIFTSEEAIRIAPYLDFGTDSE